MIKNWQKKKTDMSGIKVGEKIYHIENDQKRERVFLRKNVCLNKGGSR